MNRIFATQVVHVLLSWSMANGEYKLKLSARDRPSYLESFIKASIEHSSEESKCKVNVTTTVKICRSSKMYIQLVISCPIVSSLKFDHPA
jgi:hypothetical protein